MAKVGQYDGLILGALLGLVASYPKIGEWLIDFLESVIPESWQIFGDFSITVFAIGIGAIIGLIVDKTR